MNPLRMMVDLTTPYAGGHAAMYERLVAGAARDAQLDILDAHLLLHLPPCARVLDVGAGGGTLTRVLATRRPDLALSAVEPSAAMRTLADRTLAGLPVVVRDGTAEAPGVADGSLDGLFSAGAIKHWPDRAAGLAACLRALRPGGRLLVTELDRTASFADARAFVARWPAPRLARPFLLANLLAVVARQSVDPPELTRLAAGAGLADVVVGRIPGAPLVMLAGSRPAQPRV